MIFSKEIDAMANENDNSKSGAFQRFIDKLESRYNSGTLNSNINIQTVKNIRNRLNIIKSRKNDAVERMDRRRNGGEQTVQMSLFGGLVGGVSNLVKSTVSSVSGAAQSIAGTTLNATKNIGSAALNSSSSIVGSASNMASGIMTSSANLVSQTSTIAANSIGNLAKATGKVASNVVDGVLGKGGLVNNLTNAASNVANQIVDKATECANSIGGESHQQNVQQVGNQMQQAYSNVGEQSNELMDKYQYMDQEDFDPNDFGDSDVKDAIGHSQDLIDESIQSIGDQFSDDNMDVYGDMLDSMDNATQDYLGSDEVSDAGDTLSDEYMDFSEDFGNGMIDEIDQLSKDLMDQELNDDDLNMDDYDEPEDLANQVDDSVEDMSNDFTDTASDMASSIQDSMDAEMDELQDINAKQTQDVLDNIEQMVNEADDILKGLEKQQAKIEDFIENEVDDDEGEDDEPYYDDPYYYGDEYDDEYDQPEPKQDMKEQSPSNPPKPDDSSAQAKKSDGDGDDGWKGHDMEFVSGALGMMHDGDQQLFNPYGHTTGKWTVYSFRPSDTMEKTKYPQIAITPASFEALSSMRTMLNQIPYVVVKEYFFKNTASTMISLIQKLMKKTSEQNVNPAPDTDKSSQGAVSAKSTGNGLMAKIKDTFEKITMEDQVINIPYVLYCGLRKKMYGNTYVFPYVVTSSTVINESSNQEEWNGKENFILEGIQALGSTIGSWMGTLTGSMASGSKKLFPAPTWDGPAGSNIEFQFDLMLINDHIIRARNNYMCVNTIINNNRNMQKAILDFPGALYELWLPTGQRHLMCKASFKLYPLGLNRKTPTGFFTGGDAPGGNFSIGTSTGNGAKIKNPHKDEVEVIPDGYKLQCSFKSCLPNNLNSSIFQYYVKMTGYDDEGAIPPGGTVKDDLANKVGEIVENVYNEAKEMANGVVNKITDRGQEKDYRSMSRPNDGSGGTENTFIESTYNKKLERLRTQFGDITLDSDSAVQVVKDSIRIIKDSGEFLTKLYGSDGGNLWYRDNPTDEYYTTLKPDETKWLRTQYYDGIRNLRKVQTKLDELKKVQLDLNDQLSVMSLGLDDRQKIMDEIVKSQSEYQGLNTKKEKLVEDLMVIDNQILSKAYDKQDSEISVAKRKLTPNVFNRIWGERIMNAYERDKVQFMTSKEKTRYMKEKVLELKKWDTNGILNRRDWFFRVVVIDFIQAEMKILVDAFKSCPYDDFETIYKIVRKLNMLKIDYKLAINENQFMVNKTNLFKIPEDELRKFDKIDQLLGGQGSLYELFQSQLGFSNAPEQVSIIQVGESDDGDGVEPELVFEQKSEEQSSENRSIRDNIVKQMWGSEERLTRLAYEQILKGQNDPINHTEYDDERISGFDTVREMKERIIQLKLNGANGDNNEELKSLLSAFYSLVTAMKEKMILTETLRITNQADSHVEHLDGSVKATIS